MMKYQTIIFYLDAEQKKEILKKLLTYNKNILKSIYNAYKINYNDLKIKAITGGMNEETAKNELQGYYFIFQNDDLIHNDARIFGLYHYQNKKNIYYFSKYSKKREINNMRKNQKNIFYVFEGPATQKKVFAFNEKVDRLKNAKIQNLHFNYNVVYNNQYEIAAETKEQNKKIVLACGSEKEINKILDKSGYFKYNIIEARKRKAAEIKAKRLKNEFLQLDQAAELKEINKHFEEVKNNLFLNIDLLDIEFMRRFYDGYNVKNFKYFIGKYNKILKWDFNKIDEYLKEKNNFLALNHNLIINDIKMDLLASTLWVKNTSLLSGISETKNNLIIKNNCYIVNNLKFDLQYNFIEKIPAEGAAV